MPRMTRSEIGAEEKLPGIKVARTTSMAKANATPNATQLLTRPEDHHRFFLLC